MKESHDCQSEGQKGERGEHERPEGLFASLPRQPNRDPGALEERENQQAVKEIGDDRGHHEQRHPRERMAASGRSPGPVAVLG